MINLFNKLFEPEDERQFNKSVWFTALGTTFRYNNYAAITEIRHDEIEENIVDLVLTNPIKCNSGDLLNIFIPSVSIRKEDLLFAYERYHLGPFIRIGAITESIHKLQTGMIIVPQVCAYLHILYNLPVSWHSQIQIRDLGKEITNSDCLNLILKYCDIYEDDSKDSSEKLDYILNKTKTLCPVNKQV